MVKMRIYNQDGSKMTQEEWDSCSEDIQIKYFLFSIARRYVDKYQNKDNKNDKDIAGLRNLVSWFEHKWGDINEYFADMQNISGYVSKKDRKTIEEIDHSMLYVLRAKMNEIIDLIELGPG
jgi:hypothetical protein